MVRQVLVEQVPLAENLAAQDMGRRERKADQLGLLCMNGLLVCFAIPAVLVEKGEKNKPKNKKPHRFF